MPAKRKTSTAEDDAAPVDPAWSDFTIPRLKEELSRRGLALGGKKADLVARLEASDNGTLPDEETAPKPKRAKKQPSPDVEIDGPLAKDVVQHKHNHGTEQRQRPFVPAPDEEYKKRIKKVKKERMFMLDRTKRVDSQGYECEEFDIAGSTGNIYQTTIGRVPKCTCMDAVCIHVHSISLAADINTEDPWSEMQAHQLQVTPLPTLDSPFSSSRILTST
jgi:hypothetical protein